MYLTLSKGAPQGSILGHLLITIYSKSTMLHLPHGAHLHADDTLQYCSANTAHSAAQTLQQGFGSIATRSVNSERPVLKDQILVILQSLVKDDHGIHSTEWVCEYKYTVDRCKTFRSHKFHVDTLASKQQIVFPHRNKTNINVLIGKIKAVFLSVLD